MKNKSSTLQSSKRVRTITRFNTQEIHLAKFNYTVEEKFVSFFQKKTKKVSRNTIALFVESVTFKIISLERDLLADIWQFHVSCETMQLHKFVIVKYGATGKT